MSNAAILLACTLATVMADFFVKIASDKPNGLTSPIFIIGVAFYGLPAVGWFFMMRSQSLAFIGVAYSASTTIILAALGVIVFKETINLRDALGIALATASVFLMAKS